MDVGDPIEMAQLSPESYARFAEYITTELGIKMPDAKQTLVQNRLLRRVRELGMGSVEEYSRYFFASPNDKEREQFINAITTNKTDFFREPEHFAFLKSAVLPELSPRSELCRSQFRVWSAACSSGEEPYSLAMVLDELAAGHSGFDYAILATDISTKVLQHAKNAIYTEAQIEPVPIALRSRYLLRSRDRESRLVRVAPALRRRVSFYQLNLMDADYRVNSMFHVIFLRNVLIYFDRNTQEAVINKLCRNLLPGGYLFVGHSESLAGLSVPVFPVQPSIFRKPDEEC
jgi:chemotaxis protein methyltransferase CheR